MKIIDIAKKIRKRMAELDKNYEWLAKELKISGASIRTTMTNLKNGKDIRLKTLEKIAKALDVPIEELLKD